MLENLVGCRCCPLHIRITNTYTVL